MARLPRLIAALVVAWPLGARAQAPTPPPEPAPDPAASAEADAEVRKMAKEAEEGKGEVVEIFEARPNPPIERGTDVRLTQEQLVAAGVTDLAGALRLLPDVTVRDAGRGGFNIDVRGGRKGAVTVLVDGMAVTDPFYGTFDVSSIPVTDIVQIRMSPTPQSPLDGPGGSGGVIEVLTRDAIGKQQVIARLTGDSLPSFGMAGTARVALARYYALRISMSGQAGSLDHPLPGQFTLDEDRHSSTGSTRLEYRRGKRRVVLDGFLDSRHYISPPMDAENSEVIMIDRELSARASVKGDDEIGSLQLQGQAYTHYLARRTRRFSDFTLEVESDFEDLFAWRTGGAAVAAHPIGKRGRWIASVTGNREQARVAVQDGPIASGGITTIEAAGGLKYETTRWQLDGAVGLAVPFGGGADPWPEAKLVTKYKPLTHLGLSATGGYKGRVPTLRERFDSRTGNPALRPEMALHAEVRAVEQLGPRLRVEVAPFYRRVDGLIRTVSAPTPDDPNGRLSVNLGLTNLLGVDTQARYKPYRFLELGANYSYIRARSDDSNPLIAMFPLERLPAHRADGWIQVSPSPRISMQARVKHTGRAFDKGVDKDDLVSSYTTLEATVTAPITSQYLGVLRVDDVTDVRPETRKGYHTTGRVISLVVQGTWE